jgi:hypothetical protein
VKAAAARLAGAAVGKSLTLKQRCLIREQGSSVEVVMNAPKGLVTFAAIIVSVAISLLIMVAVSEAHFSDQTLIAICSVICLGALAWGMMGARLLPKWLYTALLLPVMMLGITILMPASDRYSPLSPFTVGMIAALLFATVASLVSWRSVGSLGGSRTDNVRQAKKADISSAALLYLFVGVLFFQPIVILANGSRDTRSPIIAPGIVARKYQTHGKHETDYIVFSGAAATFNSTLSRGEFAVSPETYSSLEVQDRVCVTIHSGLLRFRWWEIKDCPNMP